MGRTVIIAMFAVDVCYRMKIETIGLKCFVSSVGRRAERGVNLVAELCGRLSLSRCPESMAISNAPNIQVEVQLKRFMKPQR